MFQHIGIRTRRLHFQNLSFVLEGIHKVKYEDRPVPELKDPHDVVINVKFTGICGSDVCIQQPTDRNKKTKRSRSTTGSTAQLATLL